MKKISLLLTFFIYSLSALNLSFAEVYTTGSAVDNYGNIIVIGYSHGNVKIGGQQYSINSPSAFVLKLDANGEMIWVTFINSTQSIDANALAVDSIGNIYLTGEFAGTANFNSYSLTAQGTDAFILKLISDGNVEWVKHGTSTSNARANDIYVSTEGYSYVCGYGKPIKFDSLTINGGGGFTVIHASNGDIVNLFQSRDIAYNIGIDKDNNIIIGGAEYEPQPTPHYYPSVSKYSQSGSLLWVNWYYTSFSQSLGTDNERKIYSLEGYNSNQTHIYIKKYDELGNIVINKNFGPAGSHLGKDLTFISNNHFLICGHYSSNLQFGDSIIQSNGMTDFFFAKLDTSLNPIWIKHGGGLYEDEFNKISVLTDGSIITSGNLRGVINFDTLQISGGTGIDDQWAAAAKFDSDGNLIWFKKIGENFVESSSLNWFPLEVGNKWQLFYSEKGFNPNSIRFSIMNITIADSIYLNNKKFYKISRMVYLGSNVPVRFDVDLQKIIVYLNNLEHTYMDFNLPDGANFQQIQNNGTYYTLSAASKDINIFNNTITGKGFYAASSHEEGWYIFAPNIGFAFQDEVTLNNTYPYRGPENDLLLLEYLINDSSEVRHQKHNYHADIQFEPICFLPDTAVMKQEFKINHNYSILSVTPTLSGVSYINNAYVESFYQKENDTIWNPDKSITALTEKDFALDIQLDTNLYNQGYHLYYRIVARDKGIIPSYYFKPEDGYYKLYWRDSTSTFVQNENFGFKFSLSQNYPNPFNPATKIKYSIPSSVTLSGVEGLLVTLKVYDVLGREVTTLVNEEKQPGVYEVEFNPASGIRNLASGIYYYQLNAGDFAETKKMIFLK